MNKQTLEEETTIDEMTKLEILEKGLSDEEMSKKLGRINFWRNQAKIKKQRDKLLTRLAKSKKERVMKPKPVRRPKQLVSIVSIAGVPLKDSEDDFKYLD